MAAATDSARSSRLRPVGLLVLAALVLYVAMGAPGADRMRAAWFDGHQTRWPRPAGAAPVTVVAIDQASLVARGQWPWPRDQLARLLAVVQQAGPAAVGLNILLPEPDALSPERVLSQVRHPALAAALRDLPTHDSQLAQVIAQAPTVLVVAGTLEATRQPLRAVPVTVRDAGPGNAGPPAVPLYAGALTSIDELDRRAAGWGLISAASTRGVIRRMPLLASIDGTLVPALAVEMLRVAQRAPVLRLSVEGPSVTALAWGPRSVATEADGAVRVHFAPHRPQRFVSAVDVLEGRTDPALLRGRLVLIGLTGVGLQEDQDTPIGERQPAVEIHAQLLENLADGTLLRRPAWAPRLEAAVLAALGLLLLWAVPRWRPPQAAVLLAVALLGPVALAWAAFRSERWLFDALTPGLALAVFFAALLAILLTESRQHGRSLQRLVQVQREAGARIAGELQAAQQVQTATLPRPDLLQADRRLALHATLQPAREVGGDLYDFFMLDRRRLFLLVGDVAGKGLPASIFMAVSKALYKSAMLRGAANTPPADTPDIGAVMSMANAEVSRDNPGQLFVTAFAAILDLDSGELHYCNAGHDNPWRLPPGGAAPQRIADGDGPPLCALDDFPYAGACCRLQPGETLCLVTDGVTEAQSSEGQLYGPARLQQQLLLAQQQGLSARALVDTLQADVAAFAAGAEPADDLTILALCWHGPAQAGAA